MLLPHGHRRGIALYEAYWTVDELMPTWRECTSYCCLQSPVVLVHGICICMGRESMMHRRWSAW